MAPEVRAFWPTFPWADNAWVITADGQALATNAFPQLTPRCIGEVQLEYTGNGIFRFANPMTTKQPPRKHQLERLAQWIWTLIVNTGIHPEDTKSHNGHERVYSLKHHDIFSKYEWSSDAIGRLEGREIETKWSQGRYTDVPASIFGEWHAWGQPVVFRKATGTGRAAADLQQLQQATDGRILLAGHPNIHHGPVLVADVGATRRALGRPDLKRALRLPRERVLQLRRAAALLLCNRLSRTFREHPGVFGALQSTTPRQFSLPVAGLSLYQQFFRYRLVIGALNTKNNEGRPMACPHPFCTSALEATSMSHVVWDCAGARHAWTEILTRWTARPVHTLDDHVYACFRPAAPVLARAIRRALEASEPVWQTRQAAIAQVWHVLTTVTAHQLWLARNAACFQDKPHTIEGLEARIWSAFTGQTLSLVRRYTSDDGTAPLGDCIRVIIEHLGQPVTADAVAATTAWLYYDGGARGNPGNSGAGSVLVEPTDGTDWRIVWWSATYCGRANTNNYAEHVGLATGLAECARRYGQRETTVRIIGDSALVTNQIHGRAAVTTNKLLGPAARSMSALNKLYAYECVHTRRAGNKMADLLANVAMDAMNSSSWDAETATDHNPTTATLYTLMTGDITAHTDDLRPQPHLEANIRAKHQPDEELRIVPPQEPPQKKPKHRQDP